MTMDPAVGEMATEPLVNGASGGANDRLAPTSSRRRVALTVLDNAVWVILASLLVLFSIGVGGYLSADNMINIVYHSVFIGILAIAMTYVLISGQLDLSVGAVAGLGAIISAWLAGTSAFASGLGVDPFVALAVVAAIGGLIGLANGVLVTKLGINSFLVTLSTLIIVQGLALLITEGKGVSMLPPSFRWVDTVRPLGVPLTVFIVGAAYIGFQIVLQQTRFGRHLFVIGGNRDAAYNFGIRVDSTMIRVFILSGVLAGITGWLLAARLNGATPAVATNLLFDVMAAAVIGGVSLTGGVGSLKGVLGGVLLLGAVSTALDILAVSPFIVQVLRGVLVLGAIILASFKRRYR
jgi:ribose/xylose/arabinose/galactoside ABC-type transport system permease subunit